MMNCSQAEELFSAYFDGELPATTHAAVAAHVAHCAACTDMLAGYERLSAFATARSPAPEAASDWSDLERRLADQAPQSRLATRSWRTWSVGLAAAAAVLLLAVGLVVIAQRGPGGAAHDFLAVDFDHYLEDFAQSPAVAQDHLLEDYHGLAADLTSAARLVGFTPAAQNPPAGYSVAGVYVLDMPGSRCPEILLQRPDGSRLAVFELQPNQTWQFGRRPAIHATCCGKDAWIVEGENHLLAATWRSTSRNLTIVGARDIQEVALVVGHFEGVISHP